jgi:hypothetical protein
MKQKILLIFLVVFLIASFTGCQPAPDKNIVVSKNDGKFQEALKTTDAGATSKVSETAGNYHETFKSTDGKVEYEIILDSAALVNGKLPVIQAAPEPLTVEKVKHIAEFLFGDAKMYENAADYERVYQIALRASPIYNGVKVTRLPQLSNLKSGDLYASNYYYEDIYMTFANGRFVSFEYYSPLQVVETVNENVPTLNYDEIMEELKTQLKLNGAEYYARMAGYTAPEGEKLPPIDKVGVLVDEIELVLTVTIRGGVYKIYAGGEMVYGSARGGQGRRTLLVVDVLDSSIINTQQGC